MSLSGCKENMHRLEYIILKSLYKYKANSFNNAITQNELNLDELGYSKKTVYRHICNLKKNTLIEYGPFEGRTNTFYLTTKGLNFLHELEEFNRED